MNACKCNHVDDAHITALCNAHHLFNNLWWLYIERNSIYFEQQHIQSNVFSFGALMNACKCSHVDETHLTAQLILIMQRPSSIQLFVVVVH
jgi:hypothetical protein